MSVKIFIVICFYDFSLYIFFPNLSLRVFVLKIMKAQELLRGFMNSLLMTHFSKIGKTILVTFLDYLETGC